MVQLKVVNLIYVLKTRTANSVDNTFARHQLIISDNLPHFVEKCRCMCGKAKGKAREFFCYFIFISQEIAIVKTTGL